jgi:DUF4097 and DUF4098 domain-containing protein YvlB
MEDKMAKMTRIIGIVILLLAAGIPAYSQEKPAERVVVPFSNPAKPGVVEVDLMRGSITVRGYEGKDVIVEARVREKSVTGREEEKGRLPRENLREDLQEERDKAKRTAGLRLIKADSTGLSIEEANNVIEVDVESWRIAVDLTLQVPFTTSLKLGNQMGGGIAVERVNGEIVAENMNGKITLSGVAGPVVADTMNGEITVTFARLAADKPMSFSTMNGDIDITLPADAKASFKLKSDRGNIYSDFDISLKETQEKKEQDERKEGGKYRITFERVISGTVNGGGTELAFNTFHGDIFIRKAK